MGKIAKSQMNPLQSEILRVYKAFKEVCDRNGLRYFAEGGTAIGAMRHQGFIPWDDDMDIIMPLQDIYKLIEIFPKEAPEHLGIFWFTVEGRVLKIHNKNTTFIEWAVLDKPLDYEGVFIDIFPLVGLSDNKEQAEVFASEIDSACSKAYEFYISDKNASKESREYISLCGKYDYDTSKYIGRTVHRYVLRRSDFDTPSIHKFEDTEIYVPSNPELFLARFDNYMEMPPEKERIGHHEIQSTVDLLKPLAYYKSRLETFDRWFIDAVAKNTRETSIYKMNNLQQTINRTNDTIFELERQNKSLLSINNAMLNSASWKITKPLRYVNKLLKRRSNNE